MHRHLKLLILVGVRIRMLLGEMWLGRWSIWGGAKSQGVVWRRLDGSLVPRRRMLRHRRWSSQVKVRGSRWLMMTCRRRRLARIHWCIVVGGVSLCNLASCNSWWRMKV